MPNDWSGIASLLQQQLGKYDLELQAVSKQVTGSQLELRALKLTPVSVLNDQPVYLPIPLTLQVTLDEQHQITSVEGATPSTESQLAAGKFYQGLVDRHEIAGLAGADAGHGATHELQVNDKGQQVIRRKRFSGL